MYTYIDDDKAHNNPVSCNLCYLMFLTYQKERKYELNAFTMNWKN